MFRRPPISPLFPYPPLFRSGGYPGQPSHPICHGVGARAHEPPYAHQAGTGTIKKGMVLAIEPGIYWPEGGGLRLEDNFWITDRSEEHTSELQSQSNLVCRLL